MKLSELKAGQSAAVRKLTTTGKLKQRLADMGVLRGERISVIRTAPLGDPMEIEVKNYKLTLRREDTEQIIVEEVR